MTPSYTKKLIKLAEEIEELRNQYEACKSVGITDIQLNITSKINYLLGYILALKEEK